MVQTNGSLQGMGETLLGTPKTILVSSLQNEGCLQASADGGEDAGEHHIASRTTSSWMPAVLKRNLVWLRLDSQACQKGGGIIRITLIDHKGRENAKFAM